MSQAASRGPAGTISTFIARQPIVDRAGRMVAYELLFRNGHAAAAEITDGFGCTAHVVERTVGALGLDTVLGGSTATSIARRISCTQACHRFWLEDDLCSKCSNRVSWTRR